MIFIIAALLAAASPASLCKVEGAIYRYDSDPEVVLQIKRISSIPSSLYVVISDGQNHHLWFTLDRGSAQSSIRLISSKSDPGTISWKRQNPDSNRDRFFSDTRYFLFKRGGEPMTSELHTGMRAPDVIFVPDLGEKLFYKRDKDLFSKIGLPNGLFRLKSCGGAI